MRKEVLFALVAGAVFGLVIAFGAIRANTAIKPATIEEELAQTKEEPETFSQDFGLILKTPQDNDVITTSDYNVSGLTGPGNLVAISTEDNDYILTSDQEGNFEQKIKLKGGINNILVSSMNENKANEISVTVVYSSEFSKILGENQEINEQEL
jgi:hypothetical protein